MTSSRKKSMTYADAGVNLGEWHNARDRIGGLVRSTYNERVLGGFGQFGGLYDVSRLKEYEHPVLVSSVDGVGTKLKIAFEMGIHSTVGEDIVNHCIDDILVLGAEPLYFLDYLGTGKLSADVIAQVVEGLSRACREAGCVLIGGETAEMPGFYAEGEYDIAGTIVGVAEKNRIPDGSRIIKGDVLIGLRSNGLHTNGYSLARKIVTEAAGKSYPDLFEDTGKSFGEELLRPHRSYKPVLPLIHSGMVKGCAHVTGGGFQENIDRILPAKIDAVIETGSWTPDPIFTFLRKQGGIENDEMYRTFNMGIGLVLVVGESDAQQVLDSENAKEFQPVVIGRTVEGAGTVRMEFE